MDPAPRNKAICLPFASEAAYRKLVEDLPAFRCVLMTLWRAHPEIFPSAFGQGFSFHDRYKSKKLNLPLRRIKLKATQQVFLLRPAFIMPYAIARTADVQNALLLKRYNVPYEIIAHILGRDPKFYERLFLSLGRPSLVQTTVKSKDALPQHLVADEKHTKRQGRKVYAPMVAAKGCLLGAHVVEASDDKALQQGYGVFAEEARDLDPDYSPKTVLLDAFAPTKNAWKTLFPKVCILLCFLHSVLKLKQACVKGWACVKALLLDKAWSAYHAPDRRSFAQRMRRFREWADGLHFSPAIVSALAKLFAKGAHFAQAYEHAGAARTSNAIDRLMNTADRQLFAQRYFHGSLRSAQLCIRAQALLWNFHPYTDRLRRADVGRGRQRGARRTSPFEELNGFVYHEDWLQNLLIAASMGGRRL